MCQRIIILISHTNKITWYRWPALQVERQTSSQIHPIKWCLLIQIANRLGPPLKNYQQNSTSSPKLPIKWCLLIKKGVQIKTIYSQPSCLSWPPVSSRSRHLIGVAIHSFSIHMYMYTLNFSIHKFDQFINLYLHTSYSHITRHIATFIWQWKED